MSGRSRTASAASESDESDELDELELELDELESELYGERFLIKRALLRAIEHTDGPPPVLLIDEVDRADDEFEAYLLEVLSDFQVTIPACADERCLPIGVGSVPYGHR